MKILCLGMGVQSTALYYMSSIGELPRADYAIFSDPGREKTATLEYLNNILLPWQKNNNGIPIFIVNYKNLFRDLLNQSNSTNNRLASIPAFTKSGGILRRQCTNEYKINPINKKIKELYGLLKYQRYPITEKWYGITSDEVERVSIPQDKWYINIYPLIGYKIRFDGKNEKINDEKIRRSDLVNWYEKNKIPMPVKSSCVFYPYQSDNGWLFLKNNYPEDFKDACLVDEAIRDSTKRGINDQIFLHRSCKPLSEIKFNEQQTEFWGECSGNCHI